MLWRDEKEMKKKKEKKLISISLSVDGKFIEKLNKNK